MKKHMKKWSFALLAVAVCAVLAIPALAFGSAAMFSTENAVKAESALGIESRSISLTRPFQPRTSNLSPLNRTRMIGLLRLRTRHLVQLQIAKDSSTRIVMVFAITMNREPVILLGVLVKA